MLEIDVFVNGVLFFSSLAITDYCTVTPTFFCIIKNLVAAVGNITLDLVCVDSVGQQQLNFCKFDLA